MLEGPFESLKDPSKLTCIRPVEEKGEVSWDLILVEESLSVEVGFGSLHISVPKVSEYLIESKLAIV